MLDTGAGLVMVAAIAATGGQATTFTALLALAALLASATAWLRHGERRTIALLSAGCAALATVASQWHPLATVLARPYRSVAGPWQGQPLTTFSVIGVPFAVGALTVALAAIVTAAGAWRGSSRGSLDALAIALPVLAGPVLLVGGAGYPLTLGCLLALALLLTGWSARTASLAPAGGALIATSLALAWALATKPGTLVALGGLTAAYAVIAWRCRQPKVRSAGAGLTVPATAGLVAAAVLAVGLPGWLASLAVIAVAALGLLAASPLATSPLATSPLAASPLAASPLSASRPTTAADAEPTVSLIGTVPIGGAARLTVELAAWLCAAAATLACLSTAAHAGVALGATALLCLGSALRPDRRAAAWLGLVLLEASWCAWLTAWGVGLVELYTVPAAAIAIGYGWRLSGRRETLSSWLTYGPGLIILLLPSLIVCWQSYDWLRPALLGGAAAVVILVGARRRLQAPVLLGALAAVLDAGHQLAPEVRHLTQVLPGWVPIAVIGAALLWTGATYEARLRNLRDLRQAVTRLR